MKDLFYQIINLLPSITITAIVVYFYSRKITPGLLIMLFSYIILTILNASSYYLPRYIADRAMTGEEMQRLYINFIKPNP